MLLVPTFCYTYILMLGNSYTGYFDFCFSLLQYIKLSLLRLLCIGTNNSFTLRNLINGQQIKFYINNQLSTYFSLRKSHKIKALFYQFSKYTKICITNNHRLKFDFVNSIISEKWIRNTKFVFVYRKLKNHLLNRGFITK